MSSGCFVCERRVTYAECTLGNHVYHARYLDLLEWARGEFWRSLGAPFLQWQEQGLVFPIIECRIAYLHPARYDDLLRIEVWLAELGGVRLTFAHRIEFDNGRLVIEAETRHVGADLHGKPRRLPPELKSLLAPYVSATPR